MNIEILIYAYLVICALMIVISVTSAAVLKESDKKISKRNNDFADTVLKQIDSGVTGDGHKKYLKKKLSRINYLMAFDEVLESAFAEKPDEVRKYIETLSSVFVYLTFAYNNKNELQAAYFPYIIKKYKLFMGANISVVTDMLTDMVKNSSLYCRENALQALYNIGDTDCVITALKLLNDSGYYHSPKMITDGLLTFTGDKGELNEKLWTLFDGFTLSLRLALMDYFRFESGDHAEKMFSVMTDENANQELRLSAIRYFAKYRYEPATNALYDFATDSPVWEYKAISATALANYPSPKTEQILKELLVDKNWYVRYNAADSLDRMGVDYEELIDIFEGNDRYASEMLRYRFDRKSLNEEKI